MKSKARRILVIALVLLLSCSLLSAALLFVLRFDASGSERYFQGEAQEYYEELKRSGFPEDYAAALTELHLLHPTWKFVPLNITQGNATYTWSYVIHRETVNPKTNLVSKSDTYRAYHHPSNTELYDSGYYQASVDAVEYFMDPRNFLNETDVFQFFDLAAHTDAELAEVNAVLAGTFMETAVLENGLSYAEYFLEIGKELGVQPIFLAAKVRQEQGLYGTSPTISGTCGSLLADYYVNQTQYNENGKQIRPPSSGYDADELRTFDGLYNAFNANAGGTGLFSIYYNAMACAKTGSAQKAADWGGSPEWNTRWKSLWGGSDFLKTKYIDRYQNTPYLQKFNVDPRASDRNFWGQYMQNVSGALTESRSLYAAFASVGALDSSCTFLIPVYEGMPSAVCTDPANGGCKLLATATDRFSYEVAQSLPSALSSEKAPVYQSLTAEAGDDLRIRLSAKHDYGIKRLEYRMDDGAWIATSDTKELDLSLPMNLTTDGVHILTVRGIANYDNDNSSKKQSYAFLCAVYYVTVIPQQREVTFEEDGKQTTASYADGATLLLPESSLPGFVGWLGSDGSFLPAGAEITVTQELSYRAQTIAFYKLYGAALSLERSPVTLRFSAVLERDAYLALSQKGLLRICARLTCKDQTNEVSIAGLQEGDQFIKCNADTPGITDPTLCYSADFYLELLYTNGTEAVVHATGEECSRSVLYVARAALNDPNAEYSEKELRFLEALIQNHS